MEIEDFKKLARKKQVCEQMTAQICIELKVRYLDEGMVHEIKRVIHCDKCGVTTTRRLRVLFHSPQSLTIFQAGMLYMLFVEGKKPADYARYHECPAGIKFIENIEAVYRKDD